MCSSGGAVAHNDEALQNASLAAYKVMNADFGTTFAEQQQVLGQQRAKLESIAANPMGYTPEQLHTATTSINDNTATAAKQAIGAAASYAAAHGGADIGSGPTGQIAGQIASGAAQSKAQQLSALSNANQEMKQQNFRYAISGLTNVGSEYGSEGGTALSGASSDSSGVVNSGSGVLAAQAADRANTMGLIKGIAGLVTSPFTGNA